MANASPTLRRKRLGLILRDFRERTGMTGEQVAHQTEVDRTTISRIELGRSGIRPKFLRELLDLYGVTDEKMRQELITLAREGKQRGWWSPYTSVISDQYATYIGFEAEVASLRTFDALTINGLLQTEDYARAVFKAAVPPPEPSTVEQRLTLRLTRQQILSKEDPAQLWAIFDEAPLRRRVGSAKVMRDQLGHLLAMAELPNVTIQVRDFNSGTFAGMIGSFAIMTFGWPTDPEIVFVESAAGDVYAEGDQAQPYTTRFDHLRAAALSPDRSCELIENIRSEGGK